VNVMAYGQKMYLAVSLVKFAEPFGMARPVNGEECYQRDKAQHARTPWCPTITSPYTYLEFCFHTP
jgi:hypothetical protein